MLEEKPRRNFFHILTSDILLGSLVAALGIVTAVVGYQSSMAESEQTNYNVQGQQKLTDANAEYLSQNQLIVYDYNLYDGWYVADTDEKREYYANNFSEELQAGISRSGADSEADPFDDTYYEAMYAGPNDMFAEADTIFKLAQEFNERADMLQLVMMISAVGLGFAAWASLLKGSTAIRVFFALFSISMLIYAIVIYLRVPIVTP